MRSGLLGVLALVVVAPAGAQRARARGSGGGRAPAGIVGDPSPTLTAADVARVDPIAMLLARRGTLGDRLMRIGDDRTTFTAILGRIRDNDDMAAQAAITLFTGWQLRRVYNVIREGGGHTAAPPARGVSGEGPGGGRAAS